MQHRAHVACLPHRAAAAAAVLLGFVVLALPGPAGADAPGSAFARRLAWPPAVNASTAAGDTTSVPATSAALGVRADRWQHASLAFALTAGAGAAGVEPAPAALGALALGVAKELLDARTGRFDLGDLAADAAGALLAAVALDAITR